MRESLARIRMDRVLGMADNTFGPDGWTPDRLDSQAGKTFLITGGNAGVGFEACRILLSKGASVVMLNRSAERSKTAISPS